MKTVTIIITTAVIAFFIGRASLKQSSEIVYKQAKAVHGEAQITLPTKEIHPIEPVLPYKYIFIENRETEVIDTAKIISDYIAERSYNITLFDNLHGKLDITPTLQYNKLTAVPFTFTPIEKTVYTKQKWTFFTSATYNTFNVAGVGAGFFYKNIGLHYKYLWNTKLNVNGHEVGVNILF